MDLMKLPLRISDLWRQETCTLGFYPLDPSRVTWTRRSRILIKSELVLADLRVRSHAVVGTLSWLVLRTFSTKWTVVVQG